MQKKRRERDDKLAKESAERERIRLAIEEDRSDRQLRNELTARTAPVAAQPLPSEVPVGGRKQGQGEQEEEEEEEEGGDA